MTWSVQASANQLPTTSSGGTAAANTTVTKTYPSTLNYVLTLSGASAAPFQFDGQGGLNQSGNAVTAYYSPAVAVNAANSASRIRVYGPCTPSAGICLNRGTVTIAFNQPVTNPVLHLAGVGGADSGREYASRFRLTAPAGATLASAGGTPSNMNVTATSFSNNTINSASDCNAGGTGAGCGSVRVIGTVSSLTFAVDLRTTAASLQSGDYDTIGLMISVDEDFSDAPTTNFNSAQAPSHIVGDLSLGASIDADNLAVTASTTSPFAVAAGASNNAGVGDNLAGADEDAITSFPALNTASTSYSLTVPISGASNPGIVCGWIDFNRNNAFVATERACTTFTAGQSSVVLAWSSANGNAPTGLTAGNNYVRLRAGYTTAQIQTADGKGRADSGEVEDYQIPVAPPPTVTATKVASASPLVAGQTGQFYTLSITIANGPTSAAITIADALPTGVTLSGAPTLIAGTTTGTLSGCPSSGSNTTGCSVATGVANGTFTVRLPVSVAATAIGASGGNNTANLSGGGDPQCTTATGQACDPSTPTTAVRETNSDLSIVKDNASNTYSPGGTGSYTLTVRNNGVDNVNGAVINDTLPAGISLNGTVTCSVSGGGSCGANTGTAPTITLLLDLNAGAVATITIPVVYAP